MYPKDLIDTGSLWGRVTKQIPQLGEKTPYNQNETSLGWYFQIGTAPNFLVQFLDVMPKKTYGSQVKKRVKRLLEALLCFVNGEFEDGSFDIKHNDWIEESSTNPKLIVQTTLVALEWLTEKDQYPGKLTKPQIREALKLLDKDNDDSLLKILEDNRATKRGSENWHFTLKLWSKDKEENLKRFDEIWENKRPLKSKAVEASYQQDYDIATVSRYKIDIFQAPPLPPYYVDRPEYSQDLKTRLLTESNDVRTLVVTAIHGLGSVGKSTLAAAIAHDKEVQAHFCDGILWATLGQQPNLLPLLSGWVQALGDYNFKATSVEATSTQLRTLLYDKAVLLVVDDAWNPEDAQAFNVGGARCQVLVTTREGAIADVLGASTYPLDVMKPSQAMELLTKKLRREITGAERQSALDLAKAVGYLPLALELVAAEVASGTTWTELLEDFQQEVARLKTLDRPEAEEITDEVILKRFSLTASLNLSVKRMPTKKQEHFSWLGVLPEDVTITKMMAATLWRMDVRDTAKTLQYLQNKALLLSGVPLPDGTPTYRLHDLFHDLACNLLTAPLNPENEGDLPGLGITLADAHATFLEKYQNLTDKNLWHTLPNDGYIHQHLVWHLEKTKKVEEIHSLLREESKTGGNGWYEACDRLGQTANFVTDVARAWRLAEEMFKDCPSRSIALQCRYALIMASLNSLVRNISAELIAALVEKQRWTAAQGLAYAQQAQGSYQRALALQKLAPKLPDILLPEALAAVRAIPDKYSRENALIRLASRLPEILPEALAIARAIPDEFSRAEALTELAPHLPEILPEIIAAVYVLQGENYDYERNLALRKLAPYLPKSLLSKAVAAARAIPDEYWSIDALIKLAPYAPDILPEVLAAACAIPEDLSRGAILGDLAPHLPKSLLPEALAAARAIQHQNGRAYALVGFVSQLPEVFSEALAAVCAIQGGYNRIGAIQQMALYLPEKMLPVALSVVLSIDDESDRAEFLSKLAPQLTDTLFPEALAAALAIQDRYWRAEAVKGLVPYLPNKLLPKALAVALAIQDEYWYAMSLIGLASYLPEILPKALAIARAVPDEFSRAKALTELGLQLPDVFPEALAAALAIPHDNRYRGNTLIELIPRLPKTLLPKILAVVHTIENPFSRAEVLTELAPRLPNQLLPKALAEALAISEEYGRAEALRGLIPCLPETQLPRILAVARTILDEYYRARVLSELAPRLPDVLPEALAAARAIQNQYKRAEVLRGLASRLPDVLPKALAAALALQDEYWRARTLTELAPHLPEIVPGALAVARAIPDESSRAEVLSKLVPQLPDNLLSEALAAALAIENEGQCAKVLIGLAPQLPENLLSKAITAAFALQDEYCRAQALGELMSQLNPAFINFSLWCEILHTLAHQSRQDLLANIPKFSPVIINLGGIQALAETAQAIQDVGRQWT